jgi:hypothetical protein
MKRLPKRRRHDRLAGERRAVDGCGRGGWRRSGGGVMLRHERLTYYRHGIQEPFGFDFYTDDIAALLAHIDALEADLEAVKGEATKAQLAEQDLAERLAAADAVVEAAREFAVSADSWWPDASREALVPVQVQRGDVMDLTDALAAYDAAKGGE